MQGRKGGTNEEERTWGTGKIEGIQRDCGVLEVKGKDILKEIINCVCYWYFKEDEDEELTFQFSKGKVIGHLNVVSKPD